MGTRRREGRPAPATARSAQRRRRSSAGIKELPVALAVWLSGPGRAARWPPGGQPAGAAPAGARTTGRPGAAQDVSRRAPAQRRRSRHQRNARVPGKISDRPRASAARGRLREPTTRRRLTQPGATPPGQLALGSGPGSWMTVIAAKEVVLRRQQLRKRSKSASAAVLREGPIGAGTSPQRRSRAAQVRRSHSARLRGDGGGGILLASAQPYPTGLLTFTEVSGGRDSAKAASLAASGEW